MTAVAEAQAGDVDASGEADAAAPEPAPARRRRPSARLVSGVALGVVVAGCGALAVALHRHGHTLGDDFALYLRQARSVFDGDTAEVVADNRFTVVHSGGSFSPIAYPWGLPLLLSPFVRFWGLDYDRLKLVIVAAFCLWLVLVHGVVRRRIGRVAAIAITLAVGTSPMLAAHTDSILSEFPQATAVAVLVWWLDRVRTRSWLVDGSTRDLVVVGLLVAVAFNFRRESLVLVFAVALVQLVELLVSFRRRVVAGGAWSAGGVPWRKLALPHLAFAGAVAGFQLLLPTMLLPDNADSGPKHLTDRLWDYPAFLTDQLGLKTDDVGLITNRNVGTAILVLVAIGMIVGIRARPGLDGPLAAVAVFSVLAVSTHFRFVSRYYFQVVPWVVYFGTVAVLGAVTFAVRHLRPRTSRRRAVAVATAIGLVPVAVVVGFHANRLPARVDAARQFDAQGRQQVGPTNPDHVPIYDAVIAHTAPTDVIWYYRARTMTLLTDRRTIQTKDLDRGEQRADFFAQQRFSDYFQPDFTRAEGLARGYRIAWEDSHWILWDLHPDD